MLNAKVCLFVNGDQVITHRNDWKGASSVAFFSAPNFSDWLRESPKRMSVTTVLFTSFIRQGLHQNMFSGTYMFPDRLFRVFGIAGLCTHK